MNAQALQAFEEALRDMTKTARAAAITFAEMITLLDVLAPQHEKTASRRRARLHSRMIGRCLAYAATPWTHPLRKLWRWLRYNDARLVAEGVAYEHYR